MDIVSIKLMENYLPLDMLRYINEFVKYEENNNETIRIAVKLWFVDQKECKFKYGHISCWNTKKVTSMSHLFKERYNFNEDISKWNVSNVTNMRYMFYHGINFNQDISRWNVSNVTNMRYMFAYCKRFNQDISSWNVSNVETISCMFYEATNFDKNISRWNVINVSNFSGMFYNTKINTPHRTADYFVLR